MSDYEDDEGAGTLRCAMCQREEEISMHVQADGHAFPVCQSCGAQIAALQESVRNTALELHEQDITRRFQSVFFFLCGLLPGTFGVDLKFGHAWALMTIGSGLGLTGAAWFLKK